MMNKQYSITIDKSSEQVWDVMFGKETYVEWVKGFSADSELKGEWKQGGEVDFVNGDSGGTRAFLEVFDRPKHVLMKHIGMIMANGEVDKDESNSWVGTLEEYILTEKDGKTELLINMKFHKDYEQMMDEGWEKSLQLLKDLCEK